MSRTESSTRVLLFALLCWVIFKLVFFASHLTPGLAHDEMFHLQVIDIYARSNVLFPFAGASRFDASPLTEFARFGAATEYPYLFHSILGKLVAGLSFHTFEFQTIQLLRIINGLCACISLYFVRRLCLHAGLNVYESLGVTAIHSSLLMWTVLGSTVSYDNPVNLLSVMMFETAARFAQRKELRMMMKILLYGLVGSLIKVSMLPVLLFLSSFITLFLFLGRDRRETCGGSHRGISFYILALFVIGMICLNVLFYAPRIIKYGTILPQCEQIYDKVRCAEIEQLPPEGEGIRRSYAGYLPLWTYKMVESSLGVRSVVAISPPPFYVCAVLILLGIGGGIFLLKIRAMTATDLIFGGTVLSYLLLLSWIAGYAAYLRFGIEELGVNGRYAFPVLAPLLVVLIKSYKLVLHEAVCNRLLMYVVVLMILLEFPVSMASEAGRSFLKPWKPEYYRFLGYYPNPVYDEDFKIVEDRR